MRLGTIIAAQESLLIGGTVPSIYCTYAHKRLRSGNAMSGWKWGLCSLECECNQLVMPVRPGAPSASNKTNGNPLGAFQVRWRTDFAHKSQAYGVALHPRLSYFWA